MEATDSTNKLKGPVYVLKLKSSHDFNSTELLYALVHKRTSSLNFKEIAEDEHGNFCLVQKVDNGKDVNWSQCLDEAGDMKPKGRAHRTVV